MSFEERELKELIEVNDISLAYEESYDLNISDRGIYIVNLELEFNEFNEGDTLLLKLNQDITKKFTILTRQRTYIEIKEILINQGHGCKIEIINKSDDVLLINTIRGGIFVENVLQITTVYNINPKSFDLTLNEAFDGTEVVKVYETNVPTKTIPTKLVSSSLTSNPNTKVVLVDSTLASDLFQANKNYTLVVKKGAEVANHMFNYASFNPISNATVTSFGYRVIKVSFDYPVKNLASKVDNTQAGTLELRNFYLLYYGMDTDASNTVNKDWLGYITVDGTTGTTATVSDDFKTLTIEFGERSMPIGNHKFIINYSKLQTDTTNAIKDYSDRVVPIIDKQLTVTGAATSTRPTEVQVISRQEIIVKFNNPVELKANENPLKIDGYNLIITGKERVGIGYNAIKYAVNVLPIGNINLIVDPITDAYGYLTERAIFNIQVVAQPLYVVGITQEPPQPPGTNTELLIKFSSILNKLSAETIVNYSLTNDMNVLQVPISATLQAAPNNNLVRLVYSTLPAGTYNIKIQDVKDTLNTIMTPYDKDILIEDYTEPFVEEIVVRDNVMVIKFNEPMNVSPTDENSAMDALNYTLKAAILPPLTESAAMQQNKWIRFEMPLPLAEYPAVGDQVQVGYARVKTVRYVTNASGNIYPLCLVPTVDLKITTDVSIDNPASIIEILDEKSFIFKCAGDNELSSIYKDDFIFKLNAVAQAIELVTLVDTKTFKVTMVNEVFDAHVTSIDFSTKPTAEEILSRDIFNMPIKHNAKFIGTVKNLLNAKLKAISFMSQTENPNLATIAMKFTNTIKSVSKLDFMVLLNKISVLTIQSAEIVPSTPDTIELIVKLDNAVIIGSQLYVSIARDEAVIETIDKNDNKIGIFKDQLVEKFTAKSMKWIKSGNTIATDEISVVFNGPIDKLSLDSTWIGDSVNIAPGELKIVQATANMAVMTMESVTGEFGKFRIPTEGGPFVASDTLTNGQPIKVTLEDNGTTLKFKFAETTPIAAHIERVTGFVVYDPKPYTADEEERLYVNLDYKPNAKITTN